MANFRSLTEMVGLARQNLSRGDWDYLTGAADTEASLRRNRSALDAWVFRPRILNDVSDVQVASELLRECAGPKGLSAVSEWRFGLDGRAY